MRSSAYVCVPQGDKMQDFQQRIMWHHFIEETNLLRSQRQAEVVGKEIIDTSLSLSMI